LYSHLKAGFIHHQLSITLHCSSGLRLGISIPAGLAASGHPERVGPQTPQKNAAPAPLATALLLCENPQTCGLGFSSIKKPPCRRHSFVVFSRGGRIRTYDLLLPKQTRYRATLHPELDIFPVFKNRVAKVTYFIAFTNVFFFLLTKMGNPTENFRLCWPPDQQIKRLARFAHRFHRRRLQQKTHGLQPCFYLCSSSRSGELGEAGISCADPA
jgi:hypothetical protein